MKADNHVNLAAVAMGGVLLLTVAGPMRDSYMGTAPGHHITTTSEPISTHLPNRGVLSVDRNSRVLVADPIYVESGGAHLFVPVELTYPAFVETVAAVATVPPGASLHIDVSPTVVKYEVSSGIVFLRKRGAKPDMPSRQLQQGDPPYFMQVDAMATIVAEPGGSVNIRSGG